MLLLLTEQALEWSLTSRTPTTVLAFFQEEQAGQGAGVGRRWFNLTSLEPHTVQRVILCSRQFRNTYLSLYTLIFLRFLFFILNRFSKWKVWLSLDATDSPSVWFSSPRARQSVAAVCTAPQHPLVTQASEKPFPSTCVRMARGS